MPAGPGARAEMGFALGLLASYVIFLPYAHRFQRYLVPLLPTIAVGALMLLRAVGRRVSRAPFSWVSRGGAVVLGVTGSCLVLQAAGPARARDAFAEWCAFHHVHHVEVGHWIAAHSRPDDVIATHDIGAIGYYSRRPVLDMAGLVNPEVVAYIGRPAYAAFAESLLTAHSTVLLAVMQSWQEVVNAAPVHQVDSLSDVSQVFAWTPGKTHLVPAAVTTLTVAAAGKIRQQDLPGALDDLQHAVALDPRDSRAWTLLGMVNDLLADSPHAISALRTAVRLYPELTEAQFALARTEANAHMFAEARADLLVVLARTPEFPGARSLLESLPP